MSKETSEDRVNVPTFKMKQGRTTYEVGLLFSCKGKENLNGKLKRLIKKDLKNGDVK